MSCVFDIKLLYGPIDFLRVSTMESQNVTMNELDGQFDKRPSH